MESQKDNNNCAYRDRRALPRKQLTTIATPQYSHQQSSFSDNEEEGNTLRTREEMIKWVIYDMDYDPRWKDLRQLTNDQLNNLDKLLLKMTGNLNNAKEDDMKTKEEIIEGIKNMLDPPLGIFID